LSRFHFNKIPTSDVIINLIISWKLWKEIAKTDKKY
jgi:hypothetical protein